MTSVNNVGSKTLFSPVEQRARRFFAVYVQENAQMDQGSTRDVIIESVYIQSGFGCILLFYQITDFQHFMHFVVNFNQIIISNIVYKKQNRL
jgi:hypothetical protein